MKPEYKNLKLIIETPTQEAFNKVCTFFNMAWRNQWNECWEENKEKTVVVKGERYDDRSYTTLKDIKKFDIYKWCRKFQLITYSQFKQQYLNMETQYKLERGTLAPCVVIDTKDNNATIAEFAEEDDAKEFLRIKNAVQENTEPKKITVEDVYNDVKPTFYSDLGHISTFGYSEFKSCKSHVPTEQHCKQVFVFIQLLTCAYWANGGAMPVPDGSNWGLYPYWDGNKLSQLKNCKNSSFPFHLTEEAYDKFMAIEGIEPLLHTFLNTGK